MVLDSSYSIENLVIVSLLHFCSPSRSPWQSSNRMVNRTLFFNNDNPVPVGRIYSWSLWYFRIIHESLLESKHVPVTIHSEDRHGFISSNLFVLDHLHFHSASFLKKS